MDSELSLLKTGKKQKLTLIWFVKLQLVYPFKQLTKHITSSNGRLKYK